MHWLVSWRRTVACAAVLLLPAVCSAQTGLSAVELEAAILDVIRTYRAGSVDRAIDDLSALVESKRHDSAAQSCFSKYENPAGRPELEAAVMLYSESIMRAWSRNDVYPEQHGARFVPTLLRLLAALKSIDPRSPFLRGWYLLWEAVRQAYVERPLPDSLDFLDDALRAFPRDAEVQLAAGSRWEVIWAIQRDNPRLDPRRSRAVAMPQLLQARNFLVRSVTFDAHDPEARLRLVRVLLELKDIDDAEKVWAAGDWTSATPAFAYLARLFEGTLRERQHDAASAARAYEAAIARAPQAQSARMARSHLAHASGTRSDAAAFAIEAMTSTATENDPWWVYTKGLAWRFEGYLNRLRQVVRPTNK
jgi:hypothetical protein